MTTVYLCGPINGRTDDDCKNWRELSKELLAPLSTLDPMDRDYRGREMDPGIATEIVENDKIDIDNSDLLLVYFDKPSVGTSMEILYAFERVVDVVVVNASGSSKLSPWLVYHSTHIVSSVEEACAWITKEWEHIQ